MKNQFQNLLMKKKCVITVTLKNVQNNYFLIIKKQQANRNDN